MAETNITQKNSKTPHCIGVIMDGNRRWAKENGLSPMEGHNAGYKKFKEFLRWAKEAGITYIIAYIFSTENWKRSREEVAYLMNLLESAITAEIDDLKKENVSLRFIGDWERLSQEMQEAIVQAEERTAEGNLKLYLALSYGGRQEIVAAVKKMTADEIKNVTEEKFGTRLSTGGIPDPDLIIRTGGEMRLSNFLLWQSAYSELFFTKTLWPAFTREEFESILKEFSKRERRMGK